MIVVRILRLALVVAGLVFVVASGIFASDRGSSVPNDYAARELEYLHPMVFGIGLLVGAVALTPYTHPRPVHQSQKRAGSE